ncbi:hypothetical protein O181_084123 [Austropuccinia psidii MF-1]|uniref:Chromo domain-containing protein n=1 Tax=Austropuccinia psidii MF-1 TaxID=1389203 RepID=A0A9Q3FV04_9BASI|nr:hypothetical protein [Austropuccinia psidii MF-1]
MIYIQQPKSPWEFVHMDWVTEFPPSGEKLYNACLVIVDRHSQTPIFLPCHKDDTAMDTALLLWSRIVLEHPTPLTVPPVEQSEDKKIKKVIKEMRLRGKNQREYLVRYRNPVHEHEWLAESDIPDSDKLLRRFRHERRPQT